MLAKSVAGPDPVAVDHASTADRVSVGERRACAAATSSVTVLAQTRRQRGAASQREDAQALGLADGCLARITTARRAVGDSEGHRDDAGRTRRAQRLWAGLPPPATTGAPSVAGVASCLRYGRWPRPRRPPGTSTCRRHPPGEDLEIIHLVAQMGDSSARGVLMVQIRTLRCGSKRVILGDVEAR